MLDRCVVRNSCGAAAPKWSNAVIPMVLGKVFTVDAYTGYDKRLTYKLDVMRCSLNTDFDIIYKYTGYLNGGFVWFNSCQGAFCGMN